MRDQGIGSWTARRARKTPHRVAASAGERTVTYAELERRVVRLAHGLAGLGVSRGDRVAYLGPNDPTFLETLFATGRLGAVFVPLNTRLAAPELAYCLLDSGARLLVHADLEVIPALRRLAGPGTWVSLSAAEAGGPAAGGDAGGGRRYDDLLAAGGDAPLDEPVTLEDTAIIMYTSGTTGRPKGAMLSHGNITWNAVNVVVDADLRPDEVTLVTAPMFHTAALNMSALPTLLKGGRLVIEAGFEPERAIDLIERERVTCLFGVPAMYAAISHSPRWQTADLSSVRNMLCGGAPVPEPLIHTYLERGLSFIQGYGMTEASPGALLLDRDRVHEKAGSAGYPHFFTDVRVVRPDLSDPDPSDPDPSDPDPSDESRLSDVEVGEKGEIVVQGPNVMRGYWQRPVETAESMSGGWFHTGDVAVVDADGAVYVVDRVKDMIISGGENIYPAEVESALHEHPAVRDCAVVGVPDPRWGEVGRAAVVLGPGESLTVEQMREFLTGRLARYKIPHFLVVLDELPRNASGKIVRRQLRAGEADGGAR